IGIAGDYNRDGVVDATDYLVWRKNPASNGGADGYNVWQAHFGMTVAGGAALGSGELMSTAVPEPSSAVCLSGVLLVFTRRHRRGEQLVKRRTGWGCHRHSHRMCSCFGLPSTELGKV